MTTLPRLRKKEPVGSFFDLYRNNIGFLFILKNYHRLHAAVAAPPKGPKNLESF
jgi:hypothetical protein